MGLKERSGRISRFFGDGTKRKIKKGEVFNLACNDGGEQLFRLNLLPRAVVVPRKIARISQPLKGFQDIFWRIDEFVFA